jgi:hypothetical protein
MRSSTFARAQRDLKELLAESFSGSLTFRVSSYGLPPLNPFIVIVPFPGLMMSLHQRLVRPKIGTTV